MSSVFDGSQLPLALDFSGTAFAMVSTVACSAAAFAYPVLFGAQFLDLTAAPVTNYSISVTQTDSHFAKNLTDLNFCNVSLSYTHPGQDDLINVQVWLPTDDWNGRFMGTGGGGWTTGYFAPSLGNAVSLGYSAVSTDGGHAATASLESWAMLSPGNVNLIGLQDFASVGLNDAAVIGKAITKSFYGKDPDYSYWNGCSTGGRQGLMMAQRYPTGYDGILAGAPAINWASFIVAEYWGQLIMNLLGSYPAPCELSAITAAAVTACDALDGVVDGIISRPDLCHFDPHSLIGKSFSCDGQNTTFSSEAATVAQAIWTGARSVNDDFLWYGLMHDAPLSGLVATTCAANGTCTGSPFSISSDWIGLFVEKDPSFDVTTLNRSQYDAVFHASKQLFTSMINTADSDLSAFRNAGGKLITWHGLADQLIFPNGTADYFNRVKAADSSVASYYRHFEAPGVDHCAGGLGPFPGSALDSLVDWVEKGVAPDVLEGTSLPTNGTVLQRNLCMYPMIQVYKGGDPSVASSFECVL